MSKLLKKIEKRIEANREAAWYENNLLLLKIRDEGLYKKKYGTFEKYLEDRWEFGKRRGYQLMKSAELMQIMTSQNVHQRDELVDISEPVLPKNQAENAAQKDELGRISPARGWFRSFRWQSLKEQNVLAVFPPARGWFG